SGRDPQQRGSNPFAVVLGDQELLVERRASGLDDRQDVSVIAGFGIAQARTPSARQERSVLGLRLTQPHLSLAHNRPSLSTTMPRLVLCLMGRQRPLTRRSPDRAPRHRRRPLSWTVAGPWRSSGSTGRPPTRSGSNVP